MRQVCTTPRVHLSFDGKFQLIDESCPPETSPKGCRRTDGLQCIWFQFGFQWGPHRASGQQQTSHGTTHRERRLVFFFLFFFFKWEVNMFPTFRRCFFRSWSFMNYNCGNYEFAMVTKNKHVFLLKMLIIQRKIHQPWTLFLIIIGEKL